MYCISLSTGQFTSTVLDQLFAEMGVLYEEMGLLSQTILNYAAVIIIFMKIFIFFECNRFSDLNQKCKYHDNARCQLAPMISSKLLIKMTDSIFETSYTI